MKSVPVRATCPSRGCGELPCSFRDSLISAKLKIFLADRCSKVNMGFSEGGEMNVVRLKTRRNGGIQKKKKWALGIGISVLLPFLSHSQDE